MAGWSEHTGQAVGLPLENVDTDQLIPARFMSAPRSAGYGGYLLHDLRQGPDGAPDPAFPLNRAEGASILIARRNFGCGSSREAAVYALADAGFRVVVAPSFGDIFASNAVGNGVLPARVTDADAESLLNRAPLALTVDLEACELRHKGGTVPFEIDPVWRLKLINGWDDIDLTRAYGDRIAAHATRWAAQAPWSVPPG
ncbi:MAG: 3-isopropylmalate dehydratase small subunit [Gemmobacter sp.]|nr:3-isopropylmalate dehydratase small subunit [Gemmobacter sp.]